MIGHKQIRALILAAGLLGWSVVAPRMRGHPAPHALVGATLAAVTKAPLGLRPPASSRGLRLGSAVAAAVACVVAVATALTPVRAGMATRVVPDSAVRWLVLGIPLGTVWSEEAAYRAALGHLAADAFGPMGGRLLQSVTFGLSHVPDARASGLPVAPTVAVTSAAGWGFAWLYARSGSLIAPMLAHLAVNEVGAVAALTVQRIGSADGR
jgi:membrane protease YdiL (CAAX protease family)